MALYDADKNCAGEGRKRPYDIFISHSSRVDADDYELTDKLAEALRRRGFGVFLDRTELAEGDRLLETLYKAIGESAVGLVILTRKSSSNNYVKFEVEEMQRRRVCGMMRIVALRLDPECQMPLGIRSDATIDPPDRFDLTDVADSIARAVTGCLSKG